MTAKIDVCIATYKRPELLEKLLRSLLAQETGGEFTFTIIVADNDGQRSAEPVVRKVNAGGGNIIYAVEPEQNISLARNKSLSLATGDYIAIVDDDEYADSLWLLQMHRAITSHDADVVIGRGVPVFHADTPDSVRKSGAFHLPDPTTGSTENYVFSTNNSLFRRALVQHTAVPFDPAFGRTGGGDSAFFETLRKQGHKIVWCREALVFEVIPPTKTTWRWILHREFRIGNVHYRIHDRGVVDPRFPQAVKILVLCKRAAQLCFPVPLYLVTGLVQARHTVEALQRLRSCAFHAGLIAYFIGFRYDEYRGR
jgi:succinoglycan biosynthesis protein ExoM